MNRSENATGYMDPPLDPVFSVTIAIYFICIVIGGVILNLMLIHTICVKKKLHTASNYFIVNLAVCDLIRAISILPFDADMLLHGHYHHGIYICGLKEVAFMFSLPSAIVNLLFLTSERLLTLLFPFRHKTILTKRRVLKILIVSWTYFLLVSCFPLMHTSRAVVVEQGICYLRMHIGYVLYQIFVNFVTPLVVVMAMNCAIYRVAINARKKRAKLAKLGSLKLTSLKRGMIKDNFKTAKTIMVLVGNVSVCWLSYIGLVTVNVLCHVCLPYEAIWVGCVINYTSIASNPLIYGILNTSIRKTIIKIYFRRSFLRREAAKRKTGFENVKFRVQSTLKRPPKKRKTGCEQARFVQKSKCVRVSQL